jgi:hypothetical protein
MLFEYAAKSNDQGFAGFTLAASASARPQQSGLQRLLPQRAAPGGSAVAWSENVVKVTLRNASDRSSRSRGNVL